MGVFLSDTFTAADATALNGRTAVVGGTWGSTGATGTTTTGPVIYSNRVENRTANGSANAGCLNPATPGSANYDVQASWQKVSGAIQGGLWMRGRMTAPGGALTCYEAYTDESNLILIRRLAGVSTTLGTVSSSAWNGGAARTVILRMVGNQISVLVDGSTVIGPITDGNITGAGGVAIGVDCYASSGQSDFLFDTLVATDDVTAPTSFTLTAPSPATGRPSVASGNFTLTLNAAATSTITFTPSDGGDGGTFSPSSPQITSGNTSVTFTYTAASAGAKTISVTDNAGLTDPSSVTFTAYTLTLSPGSQSVAVNSPASLTANLTPNASGLTAATNGSGTLSTTTPTDEVAFTLTPTTAGTETVTVSGPGGTTATATVTGTVTPVVSPSTGTIDQLATTTLIATNFTGGSVTWSTSNAGVATVNSSGVVTGVAHGQGANQTATITATGVANPAQTATATVTVRAVAISVSPSSASVGTGQTTTLTATVTGSTNTAKTWTTSNAGVATVDSSGVVTGVAAGTATITATATADTARTATSAVTVTAVSDRLLAANFGPARAGLTTVGYTLLNPDDTVYQARTTTGVLELGTTTGCYGVSVSLPVAWTGFVLWDSGQTVPAYAVQTT